jgi:solute carrier family 29 (equilibrative nucleoside transporter), member 1/2/3
MFLAASPYFTMRFASNEKLQSVFQATEVSVSTSVNLVVMVVLANIQNHFSYPRRIVVSLVMFIVVFTLMTISTRAFTDVSAISYFVFLVIQVMLSAVATALMQNGIFAYMAGFGNSKYAQGNMTGQAIAGVLPSLVQIVSVLSLPIVETKEDEDAQSSNSALAYFATALAVSVVTLLAFVYLLALDRRRPEYHPVGRKPSVASGGSGDTIPAQAKRVPLFQLYKKLFYPATAVFLTFAITMFFPVYTSKVISVHPVEGRSRILSPACFIPLAFLVWNIGDLIGRVASALPQVRITHYPRLLLLLSALRAVFIPLYLLCNVDGAGAIVDSDVFYLAFVQLLYGATNGYIGTQCMMGASDYVEVDEREAAGSFMPLMLVLGLTVGSFLSFAVS